MTQGTRETGARVPEGRHKFRITSARRAEAKHTGNRMLKLRLELKGYPDTDVRNYLVRPEDGRDEHASEYLAHLRECFLATIGWQGARPQSDNYGRLPELEGRIGETLFRYSRNPKYSDQLEPVWTALPEGREGEHGFQVVYATKRTAPGNGFPYWIACLRLKDAQCADVWEYLALPHDDRSESTNEWLRGKGRAFLALVGRADSRRPEQLIGSEGRCAFVLEEHETYGRRLKPEYDHEPVERTTARTTKTSESRAPAPASETARESAPDPRQTYDYEEQQERRPQPYDPAQSKRSGRDEAEAPDEDTTSERLPPAPSAMPRVEEQRASVITRLVSVRKRETVEEKTTEPVEKEKQTRRETPERRKQPPPPPRKPIYASGRDTAPGYEKEAKERFHDELEDGLRRGDTTVLRYIRSDLNEIEQKELDKILTARKFKPDQEIDLHFTTKKYAERMITFTLMKAQSLRQDKVRVIHGKGRHSKGDKAVLKEMTADMLKRDERVKGYHSAAEAWGEGGTGALNVVLDLGDTRRKPGYMRL